MHVLARKRGKKKMADGEEPLLVFFDTEAANGSVYYGDIIDIGAKCHPETQKGSFQTLINTKQDLCTFVIEECGITREDLSGKPFFPKALRTFLSWIDGVVASASHKNGLKYFPVLCAHGGYCFDFLILLGNMERFGLCHSLLGRHNLYFADSFQFCKEIKERGEPLLQDVRLSLDSLFQTFFPQEVYKDRHRAMGDVDAMVKIFTETPLKNQMCRMTFTTVKERVTYYINQASLKLQQQILEDNFSRLDACSKNMTVKRLAREGLTYDILQRIFEECCSFMDFFQFLKDKGVERKVAKFIALQFGGMGLQNQGALMKPTKENPDLGTTNSPHIGSSVIATSGCSSTSKTPSNASKKSVTFKEPLEDVRPACFKNPPTDPPSGTGPDKENWDEEIANCGGGNPEFTLTFGKAIPISLMVEDLCSPALKTIQAKASKGNSRKTRVLDCQSNSKQISNSSYKGRDLKKERKSKVKSVGEIKESCGLSSVQSKPESSVDLNKTSMNEDPLPIKGNDTNETLNQDAHCILKDNKVLNRETKKEIPWQCVWFTDEASSDAMASMADREFVTVFIGDVDIRVPVNQTLEKTPCDSASQKQDPSCLDCEKNENDHEISTEGETDLNTATNLSEGESPVQTSIVALETETADETSRGESLQEICDSGENGPGRRIAENEQAGSAVSEIDAASESHGTVHYNHFLSDNQTGDSNPISSGETSDEDVDKTGLSNSNERQRRENRGFSLLETDADKRAGEQLVSLENARQDCHLHHDNQMNGGHQVDQQGDAAVVPHGWEENHQDITERNEKNEEQLRDGGHCGRILHQVYSSHGNPYRATSHYPYPSSSHPPFSFVPRMLPIQPMFMQPCLYPPAYSSADFGGGRAHVPFYAPPTIQRAMFQASSGLYSHLDGIHSTTAEQQRASHEDGAEVELEPNEKLPSDSDGNGPSSSMRYGNHSETSYETLSGKIALENTRNGLLDSTDECPCFNVPSDREEKAPVESVSGQDQLSSLANGVLATLSNGAERSENVSTQGACSSTLGFPDATTLDVDGVGGPPKPQRSRRPRNRKCVNGNKFENSIHGHVTVSQSSKAYGAFTSQHDRGRSKKEKGQANVKKTCVAPKRRSVYSSHEELKSFKRDCFQGKIITSAVEAVRSSCDEVVQDACKKRFEDGRGRHNNNVQ